MTKIVLLDTCTLSCLVHPNSGGVNGQCQNWYQAMRRGGVKVLVPDITYYESRRELVRLELPASIALVRKFVRESGLILSTAKVWEKAAEFWAISRQKGLPGCEDAALDGDMILCAHAYVYECASGRKDVLIATDNLKHFVHTWPKSKSWKDISVS